MGLFKRSFSTRVATTPSQGFSLKLPRQASTLAPEDVYTNADLDPTPPENRTWSYGTWFSFWVAASLDPAFWQTGASLIPLGLSVANAIGIVVLGNVVIAVPIILNGVVGARLRVPFPVAVRASMGYYFAYFAVVSRFFLACIWFGVETYNGGSAMTQFLLTTKDMCSYFLFWLVQLPFFFIDSNKLRYAFVFKSVVVPVTALAMMGSLVHSAGGSGPLFGRPSSVSGASFSSYSKSNHAQYTQALAIPVSALFITICGILAASASITVYGGEALWSPFDIMDMWTDRASIAFAALAWMLAGITANITANSIAAANDLVTLFPRFVNITRGQILTSLIGGWAVVPWYIMASSGTFLTFVSGYSIVLGPLAAFITCDYYLVKKFAYHVPELYDPRGIYRYSGGFNLRAVVTLVAVVAPLLPGLIDAINPDVYIGNISWWYAPGFITAYIPALLVYYALNVAFPHYPSLVAEAVTADDMDMSVGPEYDQSFKASESEPKEAYEMSGLPPVSHA
ncbi:SPOSA6832_01199 [Sporobolomyces salmonicolor]|uniref:SPOSA6832_01199-mRNA-1:cds n=1 Tax=Sporidiobolus salmonicolor TaxID=5005 RepID=A0A0D6EIS7_SPOSA|nr:SPOSA6832_01199 [Sporobolomyces salmonicolor]